MPRNILEGLQCTVMYAWISKCSVEFGLIEVVSQTAFKVMQLIMSDVKKQ